MQRPLRLLAISLLALNCSGCGSPPGDTELIVRFRSHRAQIESLVDMIRHDEVLIRVDDDWTEPHDPAAVGISPQRITEYRQIFSGIGCPRGFIYNPQTGTITLLAWTAGLAVSGSSKSFVFNPPDPTPLVAELDAYLRSGAHQSQGYPLGYRHLEGLWYLKYEAN